MAAAINPRRHRLPQHQAATDGARRGQAHSRLWSGLSNTGAGIESKRATPTLQALRRLFIAPSKLSLDRGQGRLQQEDGHFYRPENLRKPDIAKVIQEARSKRTGITSGRGSSFVLLRSENMAYPEIVARLYPWVLGCRLRRRKG